MKKILILGGIIIFVLTSIILKAQKLETKPWEYNLNVELNDTVLYVNVNLKACKTANWNKDYFLFNRYIKIDKASLNNKPLTYTRSNDTLYFKSPKSEEINISLNYKIPCSLSESSKIIKAHGNNRFAYPAQLDTNQIFCERYSKYYQVIYGNFSNYKEKITVRNREEAKDWEDAHISKPSPSSGPVKVDDPVKMYLKQMGKIPLLSREDELSLAKEIEEKEIKLREVVLKTKVAREEYLILANKIIGEEVNIDDVVKGEVANRDREKRRIKRLTYKLRRTRKKSDNSAILMKFNFTMSVVERTIGIIKKALREIESINRKIARIKRKNLRNNSDICKV